jgi:hypothetical protein
MIVRTALTIHVTDIKAGGAAAARVADGAGADALASLADEIALRILVGVAQVATRAAVLAIVLEIHAALLPGNRAQGEWSLAGRALPIRAILPCPACIAAGAAVVGVVGDAQALPIATERPPRAIRLALVLVLLLVLLLLVVFGLSRQETSPSG